MSWLWILPLLSIWRLFRLRLFPGCGSGPLVGFLLGIGGVCCVRCLRLCSLPMALLWVPSCRCLRYDYLLLQLRRHQLGMGLS